MAHIHTNPGQHDFTASAFIVRTDGLQPRLLLHRHKILGTFIQFGGHVELNETPWQAVAHEILEESGYSFNQLMVMQPVGSLQKLTGVNLHPLPVGLMTHAFSDEHFHTDIEYLFVTREKPIHKISDKESKDVRMFTKGELLTQKTVDIPHNIIEIGTFIFDFCLENWTAIKTSAYK